MIVLGLTGGVGMGKSTAAGFLRQRDVAIVDTDDLARELVEPGQPALDEIKSAFGGNVTHSTGELNRKEMARIIFADSKARITVEAILHPRIRDRWLAQVEAWRGQRRSLAAVVIPLLFETKAEPHFDHIICAACSSGAQRERLMARGWSADQIAQRNAAQMPIEQKIASAGFVVWTEGNLEKHSRQVDRILARLLQ
jgi:dephospho-CoA kinase